MTAGTDRIARQYGLRISEMFRRLPEMATKAHQNKAMPGLFGLASVVHYESDS
jgi:hypothetical protein